MRLDPTKASTRKTIFGIWLIWWNSLEKGRNSWWWWEWSFSYTESGGEKPKEDSMSTWVWKRHLCPLWDFVIFKKNHNYRNRIDRNSLFPWKASPSDIAIALIGPFSFLCGFKCYKNSEFKATVQTYSYTVPHSECGRENQVCGNQDRTTEALLMATSLQTRPPPSVPSSNYKPKNNIIHHTTIKSEIQMI